MGSRQLIGYRARRIYIGALAKAMISFQGHNNKSLHTRPQRKETPQKSLIRSHFEDETSQFSSQSNCASDGASRFAAIVARGGCFYSFHAILLQLGITAMVLFRAAFHVTPIK